MNFFEVYYKDEEDKIIETLKVKRVKRNKHIDLFNLLKSPMFEFFKHNCGIGSLLADDNFYKDLQKIANLLPVVGHEKPGFSLEKIENDFEQIIRIFFTTSRIIDGNLEDDAQPKPSLIAQLHYFDYLGEIKAIGQKIFEQEKEALTQRRLAITELESKIQTP